MTTTRHHRTWTKADGARVVEAAARALKEQYVFPERGAALARHLRTWWAGNPDVPADIPGFCAALTARIHAHTPDLHLKVTPAPCRNADAQHAFATAYGLQRIEILRDNVGLIELQEFCDVQDAAPLIAAAMQIVSGTRALVIDLRRNGGGDPHCTAFLAGFFFARVTHLSTFRTRDDAVGSQSWTPAYLPAPRYLERPVVILTSRRTGSGAEEFAYVMRHSGRARLIGEPTAGAAHPGIWVELDPLIRMFVATGCPVVAATGSNWEGAGVEPHEAVAAEEALERALTYLASA